MNHLAIDIPPGTLQGAAADSTHSHTQRAVHETIEQACAQACRAIAPAWPLDRAIAVNPHWSRIGLPVRRVAARMAALGGIQVFPPRSEQQRAWQTGRISPADLALALRQLPQAQAQGITPQQCIEALASPPPVAQLPLLIDVLVGFDRCAAFNEACPGYYTSLAAAPAACRALMPTVDSGL